MQETDTEKTESETQPARLSFFKRWWFWFILLCLVAGGAFAVWNKQQLPAAPASGKSGTRAASLPTPVSVAPVRTGGMNLYLTGLGSVIPLNTVTVKSRVDGQLMEVHYREGQNVTKGALLAVIDPRPFQVQLTQAEGQMARDREQLNNARMDLERYRTLWKQDSIPRQQLDTQEALVRQFEGAVRVDQGQIDNARLQLIYSRVTAPIGGRVGLRQVDAGNIVHANDQTGLVVITQLQPITVVFPIAEDSLPQLMARLKKGERLAVDAFDREQKKRLAGGTLLTVDNQIDPATGTVKLKAVFPNSGNELFPNQFVNARLLVETRHDSIIVPAVAVQRGPQGAFVYVVNADSTVTLRPITTGVSQDGDTAVTKGLQAGEKVVVDGAERLREGSKVEVKEPGQKEQGAPKGQRNEGKR